ncbi:MAG TPA: efflux RND transporter periplasmic adaptor subunit, partial [Thauera sp.]|nr:efflux RND transporter periplasmic adaptor subunit [Thauera sp.]
VYFPEGAQPPQDGEATLGEDVTLALRLRETAGAVDRQGRTLRARYTVLGPPDALVLGAVLRARFDAPLAEAEGEFVVPLGALNDRGQGPRVWRLRDGRVEAVAVTVVGTDGEAARVRGPLAAGDRVVALGTHLLVEDMAVRELGR